MYSVHLFSLSIGFSVVAVGFLANFFMNEKLTKNSVNGMISFLSIPLGHGVVGLLLMTVAMLALGILCFWTSSLFTFFPGINCAFELGGIAVLWVRYFMG